LKKKEIAVGDSTELEIIFLTGKRRGLSTKSPTIQTNEGPPKRRVTIKATVVQQPDSTYPIIIKPYRLYVSKAGETDINFANFEITNVSDTDLGVKVAGAPPGYFDVELPETIKSGETAECKLMVRDDHLAEAFEKSITLELTDQAQSRFSVPVIRRFIGQQNIQKAETGQSSGK